MVVGSQAYDRQLLAHKQLTADLGYAAVRILVIDDYRPHGESLQELLRTEGHEALYAESYKGAQGYLDLLRFDLAFLDFDMPDMKGPVVAGKLSERFPTLRSVIISGHMPEEDLLVELGDLPLLRKPVSPPTLREFLQQVEREMSGLAVVLRSLFPVTPYCPAGPHVGFMKAGDLLPARPLPPIRPQESRGRKPRRRGTKKQ
jgi:CheY-like chemotaxis protein